MFGYVRPPLAALPKEEKDRFLRMYCGLCHTLARRYGPPSRWILNYDFTFLAILLSDGEGTAERRRCAAHPLGGRACLETSPALELAADESVILAWRKLRDDVDDQPLFRGLPERSAAAALRSACKQAAARRPAFDAEVRRQLEILCALERENCPSLDRPAEAFALLLRSAAAEAEGVRRRVLEQILYHLGRWIYLIDAADDLKRDARSGNYNPVALRYNLRGGVWTAEARLEFARTLDHSVHAIAAAFELWDFGVWRPILEATFYGGLFQTGRAVLDGTFHRRVFRRTRERESMDENAENQDEKQENREENQEGGSAADG